MDPIEAIAPAVAQSTQQQATNAFGLGFQDLLQIVLTQLTYQDPLKPLENFEFVSQLAQFSQIQQGENMTRSLGDILQSERTAQAAGLLGQIVDVPAGAALISGTVTAVGFDNGDARITLETDDGRTINGIALSAVTQIRMGES
ncbi:MAG: flagellar hook capping FlgD N-terminal domain-containing protein [Pseudomonadota bacterium]